MVLTESNWSEKLMNNSAFIVNVTKGLNESCNKENRQKPTVVPKTTDALANNYEHVKAIADNIRHRLHIIEHPTIVIVCGSGLSTLANEVKDARKVAYADIPGFPVGNVKGHSGTLVYGKLGGKTVLCMQGRVHVYETDSPSIAAMPIRIAYLLGCSTVVMTAAVGGVDKSLEQGDIVAVEDHIAMPLMSLRSPLVGANDERFGPRFISTVNLYDRKLRDIAQSTADKQGIDLHHGVYAMVGGPQFETPAEVRMLRQMGASVVGMSVAHEALIARHMDMKTLALSFVSNVCEDRSNLPGQQDGLHDEVLESGRDITQKMCKLVLEIVKKI